MTPAVELRQISKFFGNTAANDRVDLALYPGEIYSIVGGNGAGKSTLVKIIYGMLQPDSGTLYINGARRVIRHPIDARAASIGMVHQELLLLEPQTVLENIILGSEPTRFGFLQLAAAEHAIQKIIDRHKLDLRLHKKVREMTVGERQRILITRLLFQKAQILILDEPTAALTPQETETLFSVLNSLKETGASIIFISHKLQEVLKFSDRISVMRTGKIVATCDTQEAREEEIIELMTGEKLPPLRRTIRSIDQKIVDRDSAVAFALHNIRSAAGSRPLKGISVSVNSGEIVGILGVEGNGQNELELIISGQENRYTGRIRIDGDLLPKGDPAALKSNRIGYIPAHREICGMIGSFSVAENMILGWHYFASVSGRAFLKYKAINTLADTLIEEYEIDTPDGSAQIRTLSGGNQQKVVLSRELSQQPRVLFACNPTRGVDIKTTQYIHRRFFELSEAGCAILVMLSDIDEAKLLCSRIAILYDGQITTTVESNEAAESELGYYMIGGA